MVITDSTAWLCQAVPPAAAVKTIRMPSYSIFSQDIACWIGLPVWETSWAAGFPPRGPSDSWDTQSRVTAQAEACSSPIPCCAVWKKSSRFFSGFGRWICDCGIARR